jgi:hypothetical protein
VSILIARRSGVGRCLGCCPGKKVSMMRMLLPQQGQGHSGAFAFPGAIVPARSASPVELSLHLPRHASGMRMSWRRGSLFRVTRCKYAAPAVILREDAKLSITALSSWTPMLSGSIIPSGPYSAMNGNSHCFRNSCNGLNFAFPARGKRRTSSGRSQRL